MAVHLEQVAYHGWHRCLHLSNEMVELIVTTEVGPRVIRFGFIGGGNEFAEFADMLGKTGGDEWRIYGGHRLWHAPEGQPRSYVPDNGPVAFDPLPAGLRVVQPVEPATGIQKEMEITLVEGEPAARVIHRLRNRGVWPVELAPWALSVMAPGGTAIMPLPPRGSHAENLRPNTTLSLWPYTDLSDARWNWGQEWILLRQDMHRPAPLKIGLACTPGWLAYWREGHLFMIRFEHQAGVRYPDLGASAELFTNDLFLELETLGPLTTLRPGEAVEHTESWRLFADIPPIHTEADVRAHLQPLLGVTDGG